MRTLGLIVSLVVVSALGRADAQPKEDPDKLFIEGRELINKGEYAAACDKFLAVNRLRPDAPSVLLNLGICYEKQDKLATAYRMYDKAREKGQYTEDLKPFAVEAIERLKAIKDKRATVTFDLAKTQPNVIVSVDGVTVDRREMVEPYPVDAGKRKIEAAAPGMKTHVAEVEFGNGETRSVAIPLLSKAPAPGRPPLLSRKVGIGLFASGAVLFGISIGGSMYTKANPGPGNANRTDYGPKESRRLTVLTVVGGVGATVGLVGLYYTFFAKDPTAERRLAIAPLVGNDSVGLSLTRGF